MARTTYPHKCVVCSNNFHSIKREQKTCGYSCRGIYAASQHKQTICACGNLARTGRCKDCQIIRKRKERRAFYARHKGEISKQRCKEWSEKSPEEKLKIARKNKENRFNGHRIERLEKDNYTCQNCGNKENLIVHHINHLPEGCTKDTWSTVNDLITWCRTCHIQHHRGDLR